ncbi:DUF2398 family protein [Actinomadura fibrosa]|uniref:DUF2398 family protein n=1 Tax=Actinomadura fibrosa TaxID=111802 RepID=A0ABW2XIR1_9ACTN
MVAFAADEEIVRAGITFAMEDRDKRGDLVMVAQSLLSLGALVKVAGDGQAFVNRSDDALYDVDRRVLAVLLATRRRARAFQHRVDRRHLHRRAAQGRAHRRRADHHACAAGRVAGARHQTAPTTRGAQAVRRRACRWPVRRSACRVIESVRCHRVPIWFGTAEPTTSRHGRLAILWPAHRRPFLRTVYVARIRGGEFVEGFGPPVGSLALDETGGVASAGAVLAGSGGAFAPRWPPGRPHRPPTVERIVIGDAQRSGTGPALLLDTCRV